MNPENFIGKIIGNYQIKSVIGDGAFSTVCLAEEIRSDSHDNNIQESNANKTLIFKKYVACKIIPRVKMEKKKLSKKLDQEIRIHQLMHHPNVVQLIDVQKDPLFYYVFLEYCPLGELFKIVIKKQKLTEQEAAYFFKQIIIGLQYIHSLNVAHRDLKPENILIDQYGTIKLTDFGLSKLLDNKSYGFTKTPCGSPCYASPEYLSGRSYEPQKSDIWSCGVILYAMTTGFLPWTKKSHTEMFEQIKSGDYIVPSYLSETCRDLICKLMTVDTYKRIPINAALNHPFLKDVFIPKTEFDRKFVSLRKIDRVLGFDEDFEYKQLIMNQTESDSVFEKNFIKVRKCIENDDEKKNRKEKLNEIQGRFKKISLKKTDRSNFQLLSWKFENIVFDKGPINENKFIDTN